MTVFDFSGFGSTAVVGVRYRSVAAGFCSAFTLCLGLAGGLPAESKVCFVANCKKKEFDSPVSTGFGLVRTFGSGEAYSFFSTGSTI